MSAPDLIVAGQVLVRARPDGLRTAEAVSVSDGRVVAIGGREEMLATAGAATRLVDEPSQAVVPGLHDFHLHLVGMARLRGEVELDGLDAAALVERVATEAGGASGSDWLRGRGWSEMAMTGDTSAALENALGERPAVLYSHDAHSAWASPAALSAADIGPGTPEPEGGRIERDASGRPTGVLRERATDLVELVAGRMGGERLASALDETVAELLGWGVTGVTDAGDTAATNGVGVQAALGDRASQLMLAADRLDGRIRAQIGFPAEAIAAAAELGLATAQPLTGRRTLRAGWAKAYADGALGSRTAATFEPYTCGPRDHGILRLQPEELDELLASGRAARIGLAVHAIGDRAAASVLDAIGRAPERLPGVPPDRIEHLQLLRSSDRPRLASLDVTASMQPVHCAADREMVDACWADRADLAYPWRSLAESGVRLAFGSDAPIESANPWMGLYSAVHRRFPDDDAPDWRAREAIDIRTALAASTIGPALASGRADEGHLEVGAQADLAVLNVDLPTVLAADERLSEVRARLTFVGGHEVHRG